MTVRSLFRGCSDGACHDYCGSPRRTEPWEHTVSLPAGVNPEVWPVPLVSSSVTWIWAKDKQIATVQDQRTLKRTDVLGSTVI